jgi:hypothetical protein
VPHQRRLCAECSLAADHRLAADLDLLDDVNGVVGSGDRRVAWTNV